MKKPSEAYHYTECGLENVYLHSFSVGTDDAGEECVSIPNISNLHELLLEEVLLSPGPLSPANLRFIRAELNWSKEDLATRLKRPVKDVQRWEKEGIDERDMDALIRSYAMLQRNPSRHGPAENATIRIDASDPEHYKTLAA